MRKIALTLAIVFCALAFCGCNTRDDSKELSEKDVLSMFESDARETWEIVDCVLMPDKAYDMVGAVLFVDTEKESVNVAFVDEEGNYQQCGTYAELYGEEEFSYLGNGKVSFKLLNYDGTAYNYTLTVSVDGDKVDFVAEDDLTKQ